MRKISFASERALNHLFQSNMLNYNFAFLKTEFFMSVLGLIKIRLLQNKTKIKSKNEENEFIFLIYESDKKNLNFKIFSLCQYFFLIEFQ